jgi:xylulokinase
LTELIIGVDIGTTSVKVAAFTARGQLVRAHRTDMSVSRPRSGWAEQDPLAWWHGTVQGIKAVLSGMPEAGVQVRSVGVVGQVNTHLFVDESLRPLAPAILWQDQRCRDIALEQDARFTVADKVAAWGRPVTLDASFAAARAAWFARNQPDKWSRTRWMLAPKDFVVAKLTGKIATDKLSVVRFAHRDGSGYLPEAVGLVAGMADRLPPIQEPTAHVGEVTDTAVATGAAAVPAGTTDSVGDIAGSGSAVPGRAMISCGTSLVVAGATTGPAARTSRILSLPPLWKAHLHAGPTQAAGDALRWWSQVRGASIESVLREAQGVQAGSSGVVFTPHLMGQRAPLWDADVRGSFLGLSSATSGAEMSRAVLEGVAMSARQVLDAVETAIGWQFDSLAFVGGGARSDLWAQIHADVLGRPLRRLAVSDAACFGAALLGAVNAGVYPDIATTAAVRVERIFTPHEKSAKRLQPLYAVYKAVYGELGDAHEKLAEWRDRHADPSLTY